MKQIRVLLTVFFLSIFAYGPALCGEIEPLFPGYPEIFDVNGTLDIMITSEKRLVINDSNYTITSDTTFNAPDGPTSIKSFSENDRVGVIREKDTRNLESLWLIKKAKTETANKTQETKRPPSTIKLEKGVWKN